MGFTRISVFRRGVTKIGNKLKLFFAYDNHITLQRRSVYRPGTFISYERKLLPSTMQLETSVYVYF